MNPEPEDEQAPPEIEIRGGDRPDDYIPDCDDSDCYPDLSDPVYDE